MIQFGDKARDIITGFTGVVVGRCQYMTGCEQILLVPPVNKDGAKRDSEWFDVDRIEVIEAGAVKRDSAQASGRRMGLASVGSDREAPKP